MNTTLLNNVLTKIKSYKLDKSDKKKIILIAAGVLLMLYIDFAFIMKSQFRYIKGVTPKIVQLKTDIDNLSKDLARMQGLQGRQAKMKQERGPRGKKIISQDEIPLLLQFISNIANKYNIRIMQIRPSKDVAKTKEDKAQSASLKFGPVSITLVLSCDYHRLGQFINDLENAEYLFSVEEIRISPGSADYLNQNVNLVLRTYVKK